LTEKTEDEAQEELEEEKEEAETEPEEKAEEKPPEKEEVAKEEKPSLKAGEKAEEEIEIVEEKLYTVNFRKAWITPRGKRTPRAVRMLRDFVKRHMKTEDVIISNEINEELWSRSLKKPPRRLRVRVVKDKEGNVIVFPVQGD
jgi:large subunit ribosomal protein L31e